MYHSPRKVKVDLSEYDYKKDIENRLFMADLNSFEVDIIEEILHSSIKIPIKELAEDLEVSEKDLEPTIIKLSQINLLKKDKDLLIINKEMRKYFEAEMMKFDDDYRANIENLQNLLNKVPIHLLPLWYSISRTTDNIFQSIIEKYFLTPKSYKRYLDEIQFDDPILIEIKKNIFESDDYKISAKDIMKKHSLTRQQLEEYILILEYNLVCFLSYSKDNGEWEEVLTPLHEWRQHLRFLNKTNPKPIQDIDSINRIHPHDFGFVQDLTRLLKNSESEPLPIIENQSLATIESEKAKKILSHLNTDQLTDTYINSVIQKLLLLKLAKIENLQLVPTQHASIWIKKPVQEQASALYRVKKTQSPELSKEFREIEKSLKRVSHHGWIYYDDFIEGFMATIGDVQPVTLKRNGRRWHYEIPKYSDCEINCIKNTILQKLFEVGIVSVGEYKSKTCFAVTPYGRMTID